MRHLVLALTVAAAGSAWASPIYRWVDEQGVLNYTNDRSKVPAGVEVETTAGDEITVVPSPRNGLQRRAEVDPPVASSDSPSILKPDERAAAEHWHALFRDVHARIARLESAVQADEQFLEKAGLLPVTAVASYPSGHPRWFGESACLQTQQRLALNEAELSRARADLDELERVASREAVPREWRQP
jgi:hypothetical protein